jgi:hypothetical protein
MPSADGEREVTALKTPKIGAAKKKLRCIRKLPLEVGSETELTSTKAVTEAQVDS